MRTKIRNLKEDMNAIGKQAHVKGWVRTVRGQKNFTFIEINDGSCLSNLQVIAIKTCLIMRRGLPQSLPAPRSRSLEKLWKAPEQNNRSNCMRKSLLCSACAMPKNTLCKKNGTLLNFCVQSHICAPHKHHRSDHPYTQYPD